MKASELVEELCKLIERYGDLDALYVSDDELIDVTSIDLHKNAETDDPAGFVIA